MGSSPFVPVNVHAILNDFEQKAIAPYNRRISSAESRSMKETDIFHFRRLHEHLATSGLPGREQLGMLARWGYQLVINLLPCDNPQAIADEAGILHRQHIRYVSVEVDFMHPTEDDYRKFKEALQSRAEKEKTLIHCAANFRASLFYARYARECLNWTRDQALESIHSLWKPEDHPQWKDFFEKTVFHETRPD